VAADYAAQNARKDRRARVWRMNIAGMSQHAIARELGLSQTQVRRDILRMTSEIDSSVAQKQRLYTARLEAVILESNQAIVALRDSARGQKPDVAASRAIALHNRTITASTAECARINGAHVDKSVIEHVGAGGGPIVLALDDILTAVTTAGENEQAVRAELNGAGGSGLH
jgi:hypothetical protein